jgi:hypothetical protein
MKESPPAVRRPPEPHRAVSLRHLILLAVAASLVGCAPLARKATIFYTMVAAAAAPNGAFVTIDRAFIERYKNRVTISTLFSVDNAMKSPNPNILDGDLHIAGRAPEIALRLVAEIINAATVDAAVALVQRAESTRTAIPMTGAWRLWPEHAIGPEQQGKPVPELTNPNPDHIFEIHPVTRVGGISLLDTFHPVEGYRPGNAKRTFEIYEGADCKLRVNPTSISFETSNWLYNDVHFLMELTDDRQVVVDDGRFVTASARETDGTLLVEGLRMVFTKGTPPERLIRSLKRGARRHVWGIPRMNFAEISRRIVESETHPAVLRGRFPYEILVLGVYPDEP